MAMTPMEGTPGDALKGPTCQQEGKRKQGHLRVPVGRREKGGVHDT